MNELNLNKNMGSIIVTRDINAGTVIQKELLGIDFSTNEGISPKLLDELIGKKINHNLKKGSVITFGYIQP